MSLNFYFFAFIPVCLYTATAVADNVLEEIASKYQDATSYYLLAQKYSINRRDFGKAIKSYEQAAKLGHLKSKLKLGKLYYEGRDIEKNHNKAEAWLQEPAANGYNDAQFMLGMIYLNGTKKIKSNKTKAFKLFKQAADDFHKEALYQTGRSYFYGSGTEKDNKMATKYLLLAVEQNVTAAKQLLSRIKFDNKPHIAADNTSENDLLLTSALSGDIQSQHKLAKLLMRGTSDHPKDIKKAILWFQQAAENGQAESQYILGNIYFEGKLVTRDINKAKKWLSKASRNGKSNASQLLALINSESASSTGGKPKTSKSTFRAAAKGDKDAQFKLGLMYLYGKEGLNKNRNTALKWLKQAADQNHIGAQYHTGMVYYKPDSTDNTDAYIWLTKAAENGHADAQYFLGTIYNQQRQYDEAAKWLDNAYLNDHSEALDLLVEMYLQGNITNPDRDRLLSWLEKASLNGFRDAQFALGKQYLLHEDIANNEKRAYAWIEKAAKKGSTFAKYKLGMMLKLGIGVRKHYTKSARWLKDAAKDGNAEAQYELAQLYSNGVGMPRSKNKAKKWYKAAAEQGHAEAKIILGRDSRY